MKLADRILAALQERPHTSEDLVARLGARQPKRNRVEVLRTLRQLTATPYVVGPDADQRYRMCR